MDAAYTGKRSKVRLAADVNDGLYTDREAVPGVLQTRGGNFVAGAGGSCPSAGAIFRHVLAPSSGTCWRPPQAAR